MRSASIIVNTFNRAQSLRQTLDGLTLLDYPSFEVVVVNGPSTDETEYVLAKYAGRIKALRLAERNLSMSRNLGIAAAAGEVVAFIDDDAYPDPAWLSHLVNAFDDDEVAGAGGPTYDHTGYKLQSRYNMADRTGDAWWPNSGEAVFNPTGAFNRPFASVFPYVTGTNASFRRSSLIEVGGYDEEFDYYLDETDVCLRLIDRGYVIKALDDGFVYHKILASHLRTAARLMRHRFSVIKNRVYFSLKHATATHSIQEIEGRLNAFVELHRGDFRYAIKHNLLTKEDARNFEADVVRAFQMGHEKSRSGVERTRPNSWFAERQTPFLPFPTRRPAVEKLHLCFLSKEYPPDPMNGISRFTHEMAGGLAASGHHIHVLTGGEGHHRVDLEGGVWVHRIVPSYHRLPASPIVPQDIWDYSASLYDEIMRIHSHRPLDLIEAPIWDSEGIAALLGNEIPVVISLHTPLVTALNINPQWAANKKNLKSRLNPLLALERFCLQRCTAILANSKSIVEEINTAHGVMLDESKIRIIPHGLGSKIVTREERPFRGGGPHVLFVGRLERRKGIDVFLDSVKSLSNRFPDMTFTIVGDDTLPSAEGPTYRDLFEKQTGSLDGYHVKFTGRVSDEELERNYAACDIFVAPSRYESFGLIYIEAMRHGKPVIGCDVGGVSEIIAHRDNGLLIPPDDSAALTSAIGMLAGDATLRQQMGNRSLEIYNSRFTRRAMIESAEEFYSYLAGHTGPRRSALVPVAIT